MEDANNISIAWISLGGAIVVGILTAAAAIASQLIAARSTERVSKHIKKLEYLSTVQEKMLELMDGFFISVQSTDWKCVIESTTAFYNGLENVSPQLRELTSHYKKTVSNFFKYRHILTRDIRNECDKRFENAQRILIKAGSLNQNQLETLSDSDRRDLVCDLALLSSLMFVGLLKNLEETTTIILEQK